jgi:hypothetical protein
MHLEFAAIEPYPFPVIEICPRNTSLTGLVALSETNNRPAGVCDKVYRHLQDVQGELVKPIPNDFKELRRHQAHPS